ncbi:MAG TPA: bifunctional phosphopantothenoylcysteine decarboxylase/phosphopantothenate--cysteine ligase CoaBC [Coriobacteriia bacterium]
MKKPVERPIVVLGVTGCIAAYKACELARALIKHGCRVKVVMTEAATKFVGPTTFRALTGEPVGVGLWDESDARVHHISLAEQAGVFVIAPATANTLAKIAEGRADDLLSTSALATEATLVIAPAMNVHMWLAETTQAAIAKLRARGAVIVEPESGELACGDVGEGRLADPAVIAEAVLAEVKRSRDLRGVRVLVTAGPTQEALDPVRFLGNRSSGKTGYAIAEEAARRGAEVTLVSGPTVLPDPFGVRTLRVTSAQQMRDAALGAYADVDAVVATAAVSDFRPVAPVEHKLKKDVASLTIELERTPDILAELGASKDGRLLVGFAAETQGVLDAAAGKLSAKNLDLVVGNDVSVEGLGFGSDSNRVWLVSADGAEELPIQTKTSIARELWDRIAPQALAAHKRRAGEEQE